MIILILILAGILRVISLNQSVWLDEAINILAAKSYSLYEIVTKYAIADFHPPGHFIILWIWTRLFGMNEIIVRIPSVIFGVLTVLLVYLIGQKLYSKALGLIAALLIAVNPLHIYYSQEARMYSLAALAVSINLFLLIKLVKNEKVPILFLIISNLAVFASDYVSYLIFPAQIIFLLILKRKELMKKWLTSFIVAIMLGIWWIPIFIKQLDIGAVTSSSLPTWKFVVGGFDVKAIPLTFIKFIIGRISLDDKFIYTLVLFPISFLFLFLIFRGIKLIVGYGRNLLIIWLLIPILLGSLISFVIPIYSYFRLIYTIPAFIILTALGILSFKFKLRNFFLVLVILIEIFSSAVYLFNSKYQREDWKGLVNFANSLDKNSVILFESSGTLPPFDYYSRGKINARGALKDFPAKSESDLVNLELFLKDRKDVYLVDYLVEISDPGRLVSKELIELKYKIVQTKDFHGVGFVYHYAK